QLPPVLYGQAEAGRHGRTRRALPAPAREGRRRPPRLRPSDERPGTGRPGGRDDARALGGACAAELQDGRARSRVRLPLPTDARALGRRLMTNVGGQAVLEGVMMRGPSNWAVAVRKPDGDIAHVNQPIKSPMARHLIFRLPVIRGVIALGESLAIGFRALAISANYAAAETKEGEEGEEVATELTRAQLIFAFAIAIGFAILLFKVSPALITDWIGIKRTGWFVLVEGGIRVTIFVLYLSLISLFPDLRRVFQYHAAEHKAINAYEAGEELKPEVVQRFSQIHPRCGTAFLLWVMVIAIF